MTITLRGISIPNDSPEKFTITITVDDVLNQIVSAVNNFFQYLIDSFNTEFPPETPRPWLDIAAPYLIAAVVFITCLCVCHGLFSCISAILIGCFTAVTSFFSCFCRCLCCDERSDLDGWLMIAPGRSPLMIRRAAFEANPRGYFRDLRGQPNNFSYSV